MHKFKYLFFVITEHLEVYPTTETIIYDENGIPIRSGSPDEVELSKSIKEDGPFNPKLDLLQVSEGFGQQKFNFFSVVNFNFNLIHP